MTMNMFMLASELYKLQPHCKLCGEYPHVVTDPKSPTEIHINPKDGLVSTISKRKMRHESGLCWYHLKKKVGLFEMKYPLNHESELMEQMWHKVKQQTMLKI